MINTISTAIKTLIQAVTDIKTVYEYVENTPTGYPYACVIYMGDESVEMTNVTDRVTYEFEVRVYQEKIEDFKGRNAAETTAKDRAHTIQQAIRADNDLSVANILRTLPARTTKEYIDNGTKILIKFTLRIQTSATVTL